MKFITAAILLLWPFLTFAVPSTDKKVHTAAPPLRQAFWNITIATRLIDENESEIADTIHKSTRGKMKVMLINNRDDYMNSKYTPIENPYGIVPEIVEKLVNCDAFSAWNMIVDGLFSLSYACEEGNACRRTIYDNSLEYIAKIEEEIKARSLEEQNKAFKSLLSEHLKVHFAIDDTGSMSNDIAQVKSEVKKEVNYLLSSSSDDQIYNFSLLTFKDNVSSIKKTCDAEQFLSYVNAIQVSGGGDCPEAHGRAINASINEFIKPRYHIGGIIHSYTDASMHEDIDKPLYESAIKSLESYSKDIKVNTILSNPRGCTNNDYLLKEMAETTGGTVYDISKDDVATVTELVLTESRAESELIDIRPIDFSKPDNQFGYFFDTPQKEVNIVISRNTSQLGSDVLSAIVTDPSGSVIDEFDPNVKIVKRSNMYLMSVSNAKAGYWLIKPQGEGNAQLKIIADTVLKTEHHSIFKNDDNSLSINNDQSKLTLTTAYEMLPSDVYMVIYNLYDVILGYSVGVIDEPSNSVTFEYEEPNTEYIIKVYGLTPSGHEGEQLYFERAFSKILKGNSENNAFKPFNLSNSDLEKITNPRVRKLLIQGRR